MTIDGYCSVNEFSRTVPHHFTTIKGWIKDGKMVLPEDRKMHQGDEVINAKDLMRAYKQYVAKVEKERLAREAEKYAFRPVRKPRKRTNDQIILPKKMTETDMLPYRQLGWSLLIDAILDLASPCMSDNRNRRSAEHRDFTISRARRWLLGESDPEMLALACQLAGVQEEWIKEKVANIKQYPSRTEMKRMLSEWRAYVGQRKQNETDEKRLRCYMNFGDEDMGEMASEEKYIEPVYSGPPIYKRKRTAANMVVA